MAVDQNSVLNRTVLPHHHSASAASSASSAADEQPSSKKVKLLCSFGGRILPRPGDGALRYVGGQTRIISVPISVSFADLTLKMADACGSSGAVAVKYQLPNEDLDSLVSVSCPEDLENMMEEYDKLDGSAKLRTFLFTPSSDSAGAPPAFHLDDTGQSYIDALNWISDDHISMQRKESVESSASYTQNSDNNIDGSNEGTSPSPALLSPKIVESSVLAQTQNSAWTETPPALPYPHQVQFINPQPLGMAGGPPTINLVPFTPHPYQPAAQITMNPLVAHASDFTPMQTRVDPYMGENQYGGRVLPPLSQLPPLPPAYLQAQNIEQYGLNQMLPPQGQVLRLEDYFMCQKAPPQMVVGTPVDNVVESKVAMLAAASQLGAHGSPQMAQYAPERHNHKKIDNLDHVGVFLPPESLLNNLPQSYREDPLQQQQQQPRQNLGQEVITKLLDIDASFVRNESLQQQSQPLIRDTVHEFANDHARPIDVRMEGLRVSPTENSWFNEQWKAVTKPNLGSPVGLEPGNLEPSSSPLVVKNDYNLRPQTGGYDVFSDRVFANSGIVPEGNFVKPINQLPLTSLDVGHSQNLQPAGTIDVSNMIGNHGPYPNNLGMSAYPCSIDPACNDRTINKIPAMNWTEGASHFHAEDMYATQRGNILCPLSNATSLTGHVEPSEEPVTSDSSLFSNSDPWNVLGVTHLLPPEPGRIVRPVKGSTEEHIKQELQAVAEGVAASVLQPSVLPAPVFITHDTKEHKVEFDKEVEIIDDNALVDQNIEETTSKLLDKMNPGLQITEDIGRLQIIKNSDLEELRELGSGTFGTVYHGKWRGSDVAIKRINDRCFAGKPSEQERMRADFWNEACKLADLHHPNVVAFYGVVLDGPGGSVATVTEYMVNGSLRNALQSNEKTFDRRKRLLIATDVAFGMEYLHGKNIVHFDLKSDNLLVNLRDPQRPICKVGDLGLSKVKCQTLISGGVRGTLPWMAPELLNGSSSLVSEKVDVFSFGIVMWELLTGEEPYADLHYGAIIGGIVSNTLRPLVPESCDPEWRLLMEKCWSAEPSERPSFTEIASRLRSVAASLPQRGPNQRQQPAV